MKKKEFPEDEGKTENIYVSNLGDFSAEFAHHLNQDWSWSRSCAYVEDLARKGFVQEKMYEDPYSNEYQAHTITEIAIGIYLAPRDANLNVSFTDIYNTLQDFYRGFTHTRGWERGREQIKNLLFYALQGRSLSEITENKKVILGNLENLRNSVENECSDLSDDQKGDIFESILNQITSDSNLLRTSNLDVTFIVSQEKALH